MGMAEHAATRQEARRRAFGLMGTGRWIAMEDAEAAWRRHPDAALTAAALIVSVVIALPKEAWTDDASWAFALSMLAWLPLTVRLRWPAAVVVATAALDAAHIIVGSENHPPAATVPIASMLAVYTLASTCSSRKAWLVAAGVAALHLLVAEATLDRRAANLLYLNWPLVAVVLGRLVQERRERVAAAEQRAEAAERSKQSEASRQVTAERLRIARDLHDVLAHHITVVNAQAGVAQYLLKSDPAAAEKALSGITENTRAALDELRATLGLLRAETDESTDQEARVPALGSAQLPSLVERFAEAGVAIQVAVTGTPQAMAGRAGLAFYRIAQEALTNASKHAQGSHVAIDVDWGDEAVTLTIANGPASCTSARGHSAPAEQGTGHGLLGMRERAHIADGTVDAAPTADGGFRVQARLPVLPAAQRAFEDPQDTADSDSGARS